MRNHATLFCSALAMGCALAASASAAESPAFAGSWEITFFEDPGRLAGATQCIVATKAADTVGGMQHSGTWQSPTFTGWQGQWVQTGDHVRWFGVTGTGLVTEASGNVIAKALTGGVSFNHFSKKDGNSSTSGSWFAIRVKECKTGANQLMGGDPAAAGARTNRWD
jgi:hypothetical protein